MGYVKQAKGDSALSYLEQALPLAQQLQEEEALGNILNYLGSAHKVLRDWPKAEQYLQQSIAHNRAVQGDSAQVLGYSYFHLAGVSQAQNQSHKAKEYAGLSHALVKQHQLEELQKEVEALLRELEEKP